MASKMDLAVGWYPACADFHRSPGGDARLLGHRKADYQSRLPNGRKMPSGRQCVARTQGHENLHRPTTNQITNRPPHAIRPHMRFHGVFDPAPQTAPLALCTPTAEPASAFMARTQLRTD